MELVLCPRFYIAKISKNSLFSNSYFSLLSILLQLITINDERTESLVYIYVGILELFELRDNSFYKTIIGFIFGNEHVMSRLCRR